MTSVLVFGAFLCFAARRLMSYLHIFQQEEYDAKRFIPWLLHGKNFDKKLSAIVLAVAGIAFLAQPPIATWPLLIAFAVFAVLEKDPLKQAKKPLVLTGRAKRILGVAFLLAALGAASFSFCPKATLLLWIAVIQALPFALPLSSFLLKSYESRINKGFTDEALQKLRDINPHIVGVTGSFGKTSVKHFLGHILNHFAPTLFTPGSVNADLGIVRVIREQMQPQHKFFIVEMGAYGIGSIARICRLTPPQTSIITAVGAAHFERFKSLEDTAKAKFEIAEAVIPKGGKVVIHESVLERDYARTFYAAHKDHFITCGQGGDAKIKNAVQTKEGLEILVSWQGRDYSLRAPVYGLHHAGNITIAFATAAALGMSPDDIVTSLKTLPQVRHRLEVKKLGNTVLIDDAYNSNPAGFEAALGVLDLLGKETRRILVTPGMVELGAQHASEHARLGKLAADKADVVLAVKAERIKSFCDAYKTNAHSKTLLEMESFQQAQAWLDQNRKSGDVVLLENDLPDLYERALNI